MCGLPPTCRHGGVHQFTPPISAFNSRRLRLRGATTWSDDWICKSSENPRGLVDQVLAFGFGKIWIPPMALVLASTLLTRGAAASHIQFVVMFDEDGNAKILAGEGDSTKFMHALEPDPTAGENPKTNVLTYWYNAQYKQDYMIGDVIIKDGTDKSDVIRFIHDNKHPNGPGASALLFYSDTTPGEPKESDNDAGIPKTTLGTLPPLDEVSLANIDWQKLGIANPPDLSGKFGAVYLAHGQARGSGIPDEPGSLIGVPDNVNAYIFISDSDPKGGGFPSLPRC